MSESREWMMREPRPPVELHTDRPHAARIYDVFLGGKTNYPADRRQAEKVAEGFPTVVASAKANRAFMHRAVRYLAGEAGIRQFLDIGTGIPTSPNLHEIAQSIDASARVVYADNDPIVLTHSRALHIGTAQGRTAYIAADATEPERILAAEELRETLDLGEPVAVTLLLLLHWLPREFDSYAMVAGIMDALPVGSALVISHLTMDFDEGLGKLEDDFKGTGSSLVGRTRDQVARFFDGLELVEPGIQVPQRWRPDPVQVGSAGAVGDGDVPVWTGVALKTG